MSFHDQPEVIKLPSDADGNWYLVHRRCSACLRLIFYLRRNYTAKARMPTGEEYNEEREELLQVRPKGSARPPCGNDKVKVTHCDHGIMTRR